MMRRQVLQDRHDKSDTGTVYYAECALCGMIEWASSTAAGDPGLLVAVFQKREPIDCRRCNAAFTRAPELAYWVQGAINKAYSDLRRLYDEKSPTENTP
jgi:hypothetical protein